MQGKVKPASLKSFVGTVKVVQAAIVALPIGAKLLGAKPVYLSPPLGTLGDYVIPIAFLLVGLFAIVPWFIRSRGWAAIAAIAALVLCIASVVIYSFRISGSVVRKDLPSGNVIRVSVGTDRTEFAQQFFAGKTDAEMVEEFGFSEEDIHRLWSEHSIAMVRGELLGSYIGFFAMLDLFVGAVTRAGDLERQTR